ncbi:uncharacterized protein LOC113514723 [Galleria mellonella]|uniref:Uncharacterized protein LOC113514723 n=1 Tax=Galleria mellonella TaxID=7137 RepID=A0ABM3N5U7_GALME|nr:uncharacterized protein LOC113514723 [Galleria mellonella]
MAEDDDGVSNKKSPQNSNNAGPSKESEQHTTKPDLGIEEAKYNSNETGDTSPTEAKSSTSTTGATRKEENPFSFRHFLKRDLSLPGNSTYENTGARPKVYANTVQHSPTKLDVHAETRREKSRANDIQAKDKIVDAGHRLTISDNTSSSSSVEIPFSVVDNSESKHNFYADNTDVPFYQRPNLASEPLGMPSLPDFVQDHILVEQAYLNSNGPISVDLDNLPDFTFNTNFNVGSSSSSGRKNNSAYVGNNEYDYDAYMGAASTSNESGPSGHGIPLDLPAGAEAAGPVPLDLPAHLSLDLTESVNPADRRNNSPRSTFPLDLPPNAGAESMRLPDFLPVHPGRTSPEPEHQDEQLQQIMAELERTRCELFAERSRRSRAEEEAATLRAEAAELRARLAAARRPAPVTAPASSSAPPVHDAEARATEGEPAVAKLKSQIKKLKEEVGASSRQEAALRARQASAALALRRATALADVSLRELLAGLEQLKTLSSTLDPT